MLGKGYLKFNNVVIPNPVDFSESYDNIENTNQSEEGTDLVTIVRLQKLSLSCKFNCSSYWKGQLLSLASLSDATLVYHGTTYTNVRFRITGCDLVEDSEMVGNTDGLWEVSGVFTEV